MELSFIAVIIAAAVLAAYVGLRVDRYRRTPAELRGDWWTAFETEFWAYAARMEPSREQRGQHGNNHASIGQ